MALGREAGCSGGREASEGWSQRGTRRRCRAARYRRVGAWGSPGAGDRLPVLPLVSR